jgi:hypothetical protein
MKYSLEFLQHTYNELRNESEIAIMKKYWNIGRTFTKCIACKTIFQL